MATVCSQHVAGIFAAGDFDEQATEMIIKPFRYNSSHRNRRMTSFQFRLKRTEMQFRRHLAIRHGGWRDRYVRMPMDMRLWKMRLMGRSHIGQMEDKNWT